MKAPLAFLTMVRGDHAYLEKWVTHHSRFVESRAALCVILHGADPVAQKICEGCSVITIPFLNPQELFDRPRRKMMYRMVSALLEYYDRVAMLDADEYLLLPGGGSGLAEHLDGIPAPDGVLNALGLELIQQPFLGETSPLDMSAPVLSQRRHARLNAKYCKPCVISRPGLSGTAHKVSGADVNFQPSVVLLHLKYADLDLLDDTMVARVEAAKSFAMNPHADHWTSEGIARQSIEHWLHRDPSEVMDYSEAIYGSVEHRMRRGIRKTGAVPGYVSQLVRLPAGFGGDF